MAAASQAEALLGNWDQLTHYQDTGVSNYGGVPFVSTLNGWQTLHFQPAVSSEEGYYFTLRMQDYFGDYGPASTIYYCQAAQCVPTAIQDEQPVLLSQLHFDDDQPQATLQLLIFAANLDISDYTLVHGETVWSLGEAKRQEQVLTLTLDGLTCEAGQLQLFDSQGQLVDQLSSDSVASPFSLQRDLQTKQWQVQYVRD